jgi:hypothetical protein
MGKKKRKKRVKKYNKMSFKQAICSGCGLCPTGTDPKFCYAQYKEAGPLFVASALPELTKARYWFARTNLGKDMFDCERFEECFCKTGVCSEGVNVIGMQCPYVAGCYMEFREQLNGVGTKITKVKKKIKERYVAQPYPTFFCSDQGWIDAMLKEVMDDFEPNTGGDMEAAVVQRS